MATGASGEKVSLANSGSSASLRNYFNKRLLEYAVPNLKYAEDALRSPLPEKMGSNESVTWFRWPAPASGNVFTIAEGTNPTARTTLNLTTVTATLEQYGEIVQVSDLLSAQELFNTLEQGVRAIGEDAAQHLDGITRAAVIDQGPLSAQLVRGSAGAAMTATSGQKLIGTDLLAAATLLKIANAPTIGGYYHAILTPEQSQTLMAATGATDWIQIHQYTGNQPILDGEVGRAYGVRVKESTLPAFRSVGTTATAASSVAINYDYASGGNYYHGVVYGRDMYGVADIASQSPYAPSIQIVQGASKSDPLDLSTLVGWKSYYCSKVLNPTFGVHVLSTTA
jgi:N4-gp56 family major capsid protein